MDSAPMADKWAKSPIEPRLDYATVFMLMRAHSVAGIADRWQTSLLFRRPLSQLTHRE